MKITRAKIIQLFFVIITIILSFCFHIWNLFHSKSIENMCFYWEFFSIQHFLMLNFFSLGVKNTKPHENASQISRLKKFVFKNFCLFEIFVFLKKIFCFQFFLKINRSWENLLNFNRTYSNMYVYKLNDYKSLLHIKSIRL